MAKPNLLGPWGEALAAEYLKRKHYKLLACNYKCRFGEIDLIACTRAEIVFVEVKLRKDSMHGEGREFVGWQKQKRIRTTAALWLQQNPTKLQPRFDVVEIYAPQGIQTPEPRIIHLEGAFE